MRLLFGFFLLLNLAYFVWQMDFFAEPAPTIIKDEALPKGVERLVLLRERGLGAQDQAVKNLQQAVPSTVQAPIPEVAMESAAALPPSPRAVEDAAPIDEQSVTEDSPAEVAPAEPETPTPVQLACFTLGPFEKSGDIDKATEAISALDVKTTSRETELRVPKNYWVFLPKDSYSAARKTVKALKAKGIKDLFIMGKGENKDAISLGLFSNEKTADQRLKEVEKLGFKPVKETQYRITQQKWLDFEVDSKRTSTVATITAIAEDFRGTTLTQRDCE